MSDNNASKSFMTEIAICVENRIPYTTYEDVHLLTLTKRQLKIVDLHNAVMHLRIYMHGYSKTEHVSCSNACVCNDYCHSALDFAHLRILQVALKSLTKELSGEYPLMAKLYTFAWLG